MSKNSRNFRKANRENLYNFHRVYQATQDKVDVLVLSVGPDERPTSKVTFLSMLDIALLSARRAGVFVAQAAGNRGPAESSVVSYSPWVTTVAASTTGRRYTSRLLLGDGRHVPGLGLSGTSTSDSSSSCFHQAMRSHDEDHFSQRPRSSTGSSRPRTPRRRTPPAWNARRNARTRRRCAGAPAFCGEASSSAPSRGASTTARRR